MNILSVPNDFVVGPNPGVLARGFGKTFRAAMTLKSVGGKQASSIAGGCIRKVKRRRDPETGTKGKAGFTREEIERESVREGRMSLAERLHCRIRYMTQGAVFGTA